jgi:hypothetical protein
MLAGHARRHIKPRRGASEAADFRNLDEDSHVVEAIHLSPNCEARTRQNSSLRKAAFPQTRRFRVKIRIVQETHHGPHT